MTKRLVCLAALVLVITYLWPSPLAPAHAQNQEPNFRHNSCVSCHATVAEPLHVSSRFYEWQNSRHQLRGISCDKCHGGNPTTQDPKRAHEGVLSVDDPRSALHYRNQPETCGKCHQQVVSAFVQSEHYQKLKSLGLGASCNTCHAHMATQVLSSPKATAELCARCHDTINYLAPRPEIPQRANDTMLSFQRANSVISWAMLLLAEAQKRGLDCKGEQVELNEAKATLTRAQLDWHAFKLEVVRKQADDTFFKATKVRDALRRKLGVV
jgi:nitrate/TMAO reductase-like tetraheme cytochrome c subunit